MNWILESPLTIIVIGSITTAIAGVLWLRTGQQPMLYGLLAALLLTCGLFVLERTVETDREQIEATLNQIVRDVERNDIEAAVTHIHPQAPQISRLAKSELPRYDFQRVDIKRNLEITEVGGGDSQQMLATFNVVVVLGGDSSIAGSGIPRYVEVTFQKDGDRWKVVHYEHDAPTAGFQRNR